MGSMQPNGAVHINIKKIKDAAHKKKKNSVVDAACKRTPNYCTQHVTRTNFSGLGL